MYTGHLLVQQWSRQEGTLGWAGNDGVGRGGVGVSWPLLHPPAGLAGGRWGGGTDRCSGQGLLENWGPPEKRQLSEAVGGQTDTENSSTEASEGALSFSRFRESVSLR